MARILPFDFPLRRRRKASPPAAAHPVSASPLSADARAVPAANAPGAGTALHDLRAEKAARRAARPAPDLMAAGMAFATGATVLGLALAFLPARLALAQARESLERW